MAAVAHGWTKPGGGGPPISVAKEFNQADKGGRTLSAASKGSGPRDAAYAAGGPVLGKTSEFLKTPDRFIGAPVKPLQDNKTHDDWGKGSSKANPKPQDKSEKAIKPRT
jgi:hypothetical protein